MISNGLLAILYMLHYLFYPDDYGYITRHIFNNSNLPSILKFLIYLSYAFILLLVIWKINYTFCFHNNFTCEIIVNYLPLFRQEFRLGSQFNSDYQTVNNLRKVEILSVEYRALEIIVKMYLDVIGILLVPGYVITLKAALFANVTLIRKWAVLENVSKLILMTTSFCFQSAWIIALHGSARLTLHSTRTIRSWKTDGFQESKLNKKYMAKFRKSCRPLKIGYKGHFAYKRHSLLTYLKSLYRGTFRALCALKGSQNN